MISDRQVSISFSEENVGKFCYSLAKDLFPICRSLTGLGVRETLSYLQRYLPDIEIQEIASGTQVFDWVVPNEWTIRNAYIEDEEGNRIVDFSDHNLHVVGYSIPVDICLDLTELDKHLYSLPDQPNAIPYVTSYYAERWGFCLTHYIRKRLKPGQYHVVIDADLSPGVLNYGELIIKGKTRQEIFLSTYICHPSMANNELSGPVVATALAKWISSLENRYYSYRIIFIPETIGSICYLSRNLDTLKKNVIAGFNISCVGDDRSYSYLPSRNGNTLSDIAALQALGEMDTGFKRYRWLDRGSDERQYCAPGVDLPIATIMRSKYGEFPEYHTSLDDLDFVTPSGLEGGFKALQKAIYIIENNFIPQVLLLGEPQMGKRGLYPTLSTKESGQQVRVMMDVISYCDGRSTLLEIAKRVDAPFGEVLQIVQTLESCEVVSLTR